MLEYGPNNPLGLEDFWQGFRLGSRAEPLRYRLKRKSNSARLRSLHIVESTNAPLLVSFPFRRAIEAAAPGEIEFLSVVVEVGDAEVRDFWALNIFDRVPCVDMEHSEFKQTNFDPSDPHYMFSCTVLRQNWDSQGSIAICAEQGNQFVVQENIKVACFAARLKGLVFYSVLDMTHGNRTVCQRID